MSAQVWCLLKLWERVISMSGWKWLMDCAASSACSPHFATRDICKNCLFHWIFYWRPWEASKRQILAHWTAYSMGRNHLCSHVFDHPGMNHFPPNYCLGILVLPFSWVLHTSFIPWWSTFQERKILSISAYYNVHCSNSWIWPIFALCVRQASPGKHDGKPRFVHAFQFQKLSTVSWCYCRGLPMGLASVVKLEQSASLLKGTWLSESLAIASKIHVYCLDELEAIPWSQESYDESKVGNVEYQDWKCGSSKDGLNLWQSTHKDVLCAILLDTGSSSTGWRQETGLLRPRI